MRSLVLLLLGGGVTIGVTSHVFSYQNGIYNASITRSAPSCGSCHRSAPGAAAGFPTLGVSLVPTARSLTPSQSISVAIGATGGQTASNLGGFALDAGAGAFSAGSGTRTHSAGRAIGHSRPGPRGWTVGYTAPVTPGLVELRGVVNTVDANGKDNSGDMWAFHGFDSTSTQSTPVRLFVNVPGVTPLGDGCVGSFGNYPVLGASTSPTVGNAGFGLEIHGAPPSASYLMLIGVTPGFKLDLGAVGVTGCTLWVDSVASLPGATGPGSAQRAEGTARFAMPIPSNPFLAGATLQLQAALVDPQNGRRVPVTLTNAVSVQFR